MENGSIDGATTMIRSPSSPSQANASREKMQRAGAAHVGQQEVPRLARILVGRVEADVAAPHHAEAGVDQRGDQPRGLGIVEDDHVAHAKPLLAAVPPGRASTSS